VSLNKDFQVHATDGDLNSSEENYPQLCQVKSGLHLWHYLLGLRKRSIQRTSRDFHLLYPCLVLAKVVVFAI